MRDLKSDQKHMCFYLFATAVEIWGGTFFNLLSQDSI